MLHDHDDVIRVYWFYSAIQGAYSFYCNTSSFNVILQFTLRTTLTFNSMSKFLTLTIVTYLLIF